MKLIVLVPNKYMLIFSKFTFSYYLLKQIYLSLVLEHPVYPFLNKLLQKSNILSILLL